VEPKVVVEPRRQPASTSAARSEIATLPADLQHEQSVRVQLLYLVGAALWALNYVMDSGPAPHGNRGPYHGLFEATAFVISVASVLFVRNAPVSHRIKVELGIVMIVPHALVLALMNSWVAQPTTHRPLSGITVLILFVGMLAPVRPRQMLVAGLVAAAMDPLAVWIAHQRGLPVPAPLSTLLMFYPNFVCAFLATIPAQLLYRLGTKIREARALGSYQLEERLGEGGMGEVWRARHRLLARGSAVKLIRPEMLCDSGPDQVALAMSRFEREAQATAALTSPHTVRLYDFGLTDAGTFYYATAATSRRSSVSSARCHPPARCTCSSRSATRWARRTRSATSTATSSRPTSTSAGWGSSTTSSRCSTSGWCARRTGARPRRC
jgi:hypothetical protein